MSWHHLADSLSWSPGHSGKGYLLHDGVIKSWNVDPFQPLDQHSVHELSHELSPIALKFEVDPDGGIVTLQPSVKVESIVQADPRMYDAGQRPVFEDDFNLDHFEPAPDKSGKPDINFVMSKWDWSEKPHRNRWTGQLCQCGWGSNRVQHKLRRLSGLQMRRLLKAPDKAYKTPEGQQFIEHLTTLPEAYDSLYPYLAHRFKKGDIRLNPEPPDDRPHWEQARDQREHVPYKPPPPRLEWHHAPAGVGRWGTVLDRLARWHEWFEARNHPTRRGVNIMDNDFTPSALEAKTREHQEAIQAARDRQSWIANYADQAPEPSHVFGPEAGKYKGWQVVPLDAYQAEGDSEALGHCIGQDSQPYRYNIDQGNIDAYSLRDREGYPHVSWHFNPGGQEIGHMQGKSGYPNPEYRNLMSMFHEAKGLSDEEGYEERLEEEDPYDAEVRLDDPEDQYAYIAHINGDWEYPDDANIGDDTEIIPGDPNWSYIVNDYLRHGPRDGFYDALATNPYDAANFASELGATADPEDMDHRHAVSFWNSEGARNGDQWVDLPPLPANEVDKYNDIVDEGEEEPEPSDYDELAQDYLKYAEHYGQPSNMGRSIYQAFHSNLADNDHVDQMHEALQNNIDWDDEEHQQAVQHWNSGFPTNNIAPPPEPPPEQRPGQMGWDWPQFWTEGGQDTSGYNWDRTQYAVSNDERYYPRQGAVDELHVALAIPDKVTEQIHTWVKAQDWPEGTELEDPEEYHITLLYAPDGHEEHHDADWLAHSNGFEVEVTDVDEFGGDDGDPAIVLRITAPEVKGLADAMQSEAEDHELEISKFPGGYKPHITVAYGPGKPEHCQAPKLTFKTGPSSVSEPRESAWHFADGPYGYTNGDTSEVGLMMDNDSALSEASRKLVEQGGTPQQLGEWALRKIISPHNRRQIQDAKEWNAIPLEERKRMKRQHDIDSFGEDAVNIGEGLMQPFNDWNNEGKSEDDIRREEEYEAPDLIDPEMVNWDELHQGILDEFEENAEYERQQQRNRDSGLGWANRGGDDTDKMRDAFYRYHGALPEEEIQAELGPGYHSSDPRHYHNRNLNIPFDQMEQLSNWPDHYSLGRDPIWKHRYERAEQKAREFLLSRGLSPEKVEEVLNERGAFRPDYIKEHFPGGKYDTPINMEDPEERAAFLSDPQVQEIQQNGYNMRLHDMYSDLSHAIDYGQPHPYTQQMAEALQQRGYTPEQIQSIMAPQWQWDEIAQQRVPVNALPPVAQWAQQAEQKKQLDQPGDLTIPEDWSRSSKLADADHMLAPTVELREWLADLGGDEPAAPSIHHDDASDMIASPAVSPSEALPYYPPAHVPKEYKQSAEFQVDKPEGLYCPQCGGGIKYRRQPGQATHYWCPSCGRDPLYDEYAGNLSGIPEIDHTIYQGIQDGWRPRHEVAAEQAQADDLMDLLNGYADMGDNEHLGKVLSMAERSGFPDLDQAIEEFMAANPEIEQFRDPQNAWGQCEEVAKQCAAFLKERGFKAYAPSDELQAFDGYQDAQDSAAIGAGDFSYPEHAVVEVYGMYGPNNVNNVFIDFTASQYGFTEFPKVHGGPSDRTSSTKTSSYERLTFPTGKQMNVDWENERIHDPEEPEGDESFNDFIYHSMGSRYDPYDFVTPLDPHEEFWRAPYEVYHGTAPENVEDIKQSGLQPRNLTRGIQNRSIGGAVFASPEPSTPAYHYGSNVFAIDAPAMKRDGYTPRVGTDGFDDDNHREAIAHTLGMEYESSAYGGEDPSTIVFHEPIPPQYLRLLDEQEHYSSTKTADSPINQADATNDPLAKNPAIVPDRKGDPDYLQASICPNCLQTHRPDEPCPESSVTQYKQQERQWYNHDPNAIHGAPDGLTDHQTDLGKLASDEWGTEPDLSSQYIGWIPTDALANEFDRNTQGDPAKVERVRQSLLTHGFLNPVWVDYHPETKMAYLSEGNHRVTAARDAGIPAVPAKVMRSTRVPRDQSVLRGPYEYMGNEADPRDGYPPQYMHPRDIGLPEAQPWSPSHSSVPPDDWEADDTDGLDLGKTSVFGDTWDPTICAQCGHRMTPPKKIQGRWMNTCTYCGRTRVVPDSAPLLQQEQENWPPYPDLLQEVEQPHAWVSKTASTEQMTEMQQAITKLAEAMTQLQKPSGVQPEGKKPRKLVIKRDDNGRMTSIEEL